MKLCQLMSIVLQSSQNTAAGKLFADEAASIHERAINSLMKKNMLIYFAYADFEEVGKGL